MSQTPIFNYMIRVKTLLSVLIEFINCDDWNSAIKIVFWFFNSVKIEVFLVEPFYIFCSTFFMWYNNGHKLALSSGHNSFSCRFLYRRCWFFNAELKVSSTLPLRRNICCRLYRFDQATQIEPMDNTDRRVELRKI